MNYKELIDLAIADLDDFFDEKHSSLITLETTARRLMSASGADENRRLLVEKYIALTPIESLDNVLMCLILVGHEMCHLMNNHNKRRDWQPSERKALEMWADFFGARITFTLITHGQRIRSVIATYQGPVASPTSLPVSFAQERVLKACGNVLDSVYTQFFSAPSSGNYPSPSERLLSIIAGIISFFVREFGEISEKWTFFVFQNLAFGRDWFSRSANDMTKKEIDNSQFELINNIHKSIANSSASISPGLRPQYEKLIGTGYKNTEKSRRQAAQAMAREFSKWETDFGTATANFLTTRYA